MLAYVFPISSREDYPLISTSPATFAPLLTNKTKVWFLTSFPIDRLGGFYPYFSIHPSVSIIVAEPPQFREALTIAIVSSLVKAYDAAPEPKRIKALVMNNPHNPAAGGYPVDVLRACMALCHECDLHFVVDEVYALSVFYSANRMVHTPFISALALVDHREDMEDAVPIRLRKTLHPSRIHVG